MAIRRRDVEAARDAELKRLSAREPDDLSGRQPHSSWRRLTSRLSECDLSATGIAPRRRPLPQRRMAQPPLGVWANFLLAMLGDADELNQTLTVVHNSAPWHLTYLAEDLAAHLPRLSPRSLDLVVLGCSPSILIVGVLRSVRPSIGMASTSICPRRDSWKRRLIRAISTRHSSSGQVRAAATGSRRSRSSPCPSLG